EVEKESFDPIAHSVPAFVAHVLAQSKEECVHLNQQMVGTVLQLCTQFGLSTFTAISGPEGNQVVIQGLYTPLPDGPIEVLHCQQCNYTAERDVARRNKAEPALEAPLPLEKILTPDCPTIEALAGFLNIPKSKTAKALLYTASISDPDDFEVLNKQEFLFVIMRGDTNMSMRKLMNLFPGAVIKSAEPQVIRAAGVEPGYASPIGLKRGRIIVDDLIPVSPNLVAGANEAGFHLLNTNFSRDYHAAIIADLVAPVAGDPCPDCQEALEGIRSVKCMHIACSDPDDNSPLFTDETGKASPVWTSCSAILMGNMLSAIIDMNHDDRGLVWPPAIAPYDIHLVVLPGREMNTLPVADKLYNDLQDAGISVLYDDRNERAGVKFNDADLIGLPIRVTVGERNLHQEMVELKPRSASENQMVSLTGIIPAIQSLLGKS
ncbi:MAG: His/Gly/Thr/Pro-type tRNA ligase C-terminal domain-containing protein, partial [Anaerolineales bacterium]|nr:His/Gly/Thr/Pro-type tRNA ligase C-terminal domain-containing protein [Anaerolineales bacterium]